MWNIGEERWIEKQWERQRMGMGMGGVGDVVVSKRRWRCLSNPFFKGSDCGFTTLFGFTTCTKVTTVSYVLVFCQKLKNETKIYY